MITATEAAKEFLSAADIAERLGVHHETIRGWARRGLMPSPLRLGRSGRTWRWRKETIAEWLAQKAGEAG